VSDRVLNVLFLCTGNSARGIMAESAINRWGRGRFKGFSAGSHPKGVVHPHALALLNELDYDISVLRSKSWDDFASGTRFDFVFTVCDQAAAEPCPVWPGQPVTAHWGLADPAAFEGTEAEKQRCFARTYGELEARIKAFVKLDLGRMDPSILQQRLTQIGRMALTEAGEQ
jgi:arsenate reductase (thioredoxin)